MNPYDKAYELAEAVRKSEIVERMRAARQRIEQDTAMFTMVQDFRKRQWELQRRELAGESLREDEQQGLQKLAEVVMLNRDAREYMEAEHQLEVMLWDIQGILAKTTEDSLLPHPAGQLAEETDTAR